MARAKKSTSSAVTLDKFFAKRSETAPEILVIDDSDSDCDPPSKRRRSASHSSGEIEFVEDNASPRVCNTETNSETSSLSFGKPWLLNDTSTDAHDSPPDVELSFDNEWTMVDDELVPDSDNEPMEMDEVDSTTCPICQQGFSGVPIADFEIHVNKCLDSGPSKLKKSNSEPAPKPSHKLLRPLTSFQTVPQDKVELRSTNAFSVLMSSHKENEAWKEASAAEDTSFRPNISNGGRRKAPFYKVLQGMPIGVDAFRYGSIPGVSAYFLTHAHSDHYTNLSSSWKHGPIYCSEGTANLIIHMLNVDPRWVHPLTMDKPHIIPNTGGVSVTLIDANHCPGSCLFLFEGKQTVNAGDSTFKSVFVGSSRTFRYLHCGDFRASPQHVLHPAVRGKKIDHVYLDTTYLDPKYTFPAQAMVISACADLAKRIVNGEPITGNTSTVDSWAVEDRKGRQPVKGPEKILVVVGTYSIGKERIVKAIAKALSSKVYCDSRKAAILKCQTDPELHALLTSNPLDASVHVLPLGLITSDKLTEYIERFKGYFTKVIGFRPTGWTYTPPAGAEQSPSIVSVVARGQKYTYTYANLRLGRNSTPLVQLYPVPYSEHSSFFELTCFAMSLDWGKIIATVNVGSESSRRKMAKWFQKWEADRKKRDNGFVVAHRHAEYW